MSIDQSRFNEVPIKKKQKVNKNCLGNAERFQYPLQQRVGPGSYSIQTIFDSNKFKKHGHIFRNSRTIENPSDVPGVGTYSIRGSIVSSYKYSVPKGNRSITLQNEVPAPNNYNQQITLANSKYKNYGSTKISPIINKQGKMPKLITIESWKKKVIQTIYKSNIQ